MKAKLIKFLLAVLILVGGFFVMKGLIATGPVAKKRTPPPMQAFVETLALTPSKGGITIEGMGSILAAREVHIHSQVSGKIVEVAPELLEGQFVENGKVLARIEPDDYALAVSQAESDLANKTAELEIEMGRQKVAIREWELLGESGVKVGDSSLALRAPQLAQAEAARASAEAQLARAQLDLARTELKAPFNSLVTMKSVELGSMAAANGAVASLVSTDAFHVQVSIPERQLGFLEVPGAKARVRVGSSETPLPGHAISLLGNLDPDGRMARVLVEVRDPLGLTPENADRPKLLLGAYVTVELEGRPLPGIMTIPRDALRADDTVWLLRDNTLEIRKVEVLWKNRESAMIRKGLEAGEKLITTSLSFASAGMLVSDVNDPAAKQRPAGKGPGKGQGKGPGGKPGKGPGSGPRPEAPSN